MASAGSDGGPLSGRVVALVRPRERLEPWRCVLEEAGARVVAAPAIEIMPPEELAELDAALLRLSHGSYDWLVFTSAFAVEHFLSRFETLGLDRGYLSGRKDEPGLQREARRVRGGAVSRGGAEGSEAPRAPDGPPAPKVAAVGRKTAEALSREGIIVDRVPERQDARGMLESFSDEELEGASMLMPRAAAGRDTFPDGARARGASVDVVTAYRTVERQSAARPLRDLLVRGRLDALVLASPSQARAVMAGLGADRALLSSCLVACIGSTTALAVEEAGIAAATAERPEPEAVVALLVSELKGR